MISLYKYTIFKYIYKEAFPNFFMSSGLGGALHRLLACFLMLPFLLLVPEANAWEGVLLRVQDGDTVLVAPEGASHGDMLVRLYGIDAPELDQPGGKASRNALQQLVQPGDSVKIIPRSDDRYGRGIGLLIRNEQILNFEMVRTGQAWVYEKYCKDHFCRDWKRAQKQAQQAEIGLWHEKSPVQPWEWRKKSR